MLIEEKLTLQTMPQFYGSGMFHISNRLHSLLYGYKYGSLPIALIDQNHKKIESTFSDNNLSSLIVDVFADDNTTKERADDIILQRDKLFKELQETEEKNRKELESVFEHISEL